MNSMFRHFNNYTLLQKKPTFLEDAFLLGKIVCQCTLGHTSFWPLGKIFKMLCQGQWPRGTRENGQIKLTLLLEKSVVHFHSCWFCIGMMLPVHYFPITSITLGVWKDVGWECLAYMRINAKSCNTYVCHNPFCWYASLGAKLNMKWPWVLGT